MSIFNINESGTENKAPESNAVFNKFYNTPLITGVVQNNLFIRYDKTLYDHKLNSQINDGGRPTPNNNIRSIYIDWTPRAIREDKYDLLSGKWDAGYPQNNTYSLCDQKLSTIYSLGSYQVSRDERVITSFPRNQTLSNVDGKNSGCDEYQPIVTPTLTPTSSVTPTLTPTPSKTPNIEYKTYSRDDNVSTSQDNNWGILRAVISGNIPNWGQA